jgi:alkylation response protein AidB-like acyl-CoA dehydrogenase
MTDDELPELLWATPGLETVAGGIDRETAAGLIDAASRLAAEVLAPLGARADVEGCRLEAGRMRTPAGYPRGWAQLGAEGWIAPDLPEAAGGRACRCRCTF